MFTLHLQVYRAVRVAVLGLDPEGQVPSLEIGSSAIGNVGNLVFFYVAYDVPSFSWPYSVIRKVISGHRC